MQIRKVTEGTYNVGCKKYNMRIRLPQHKISSQKLCSRSFYHHWCRFNRMEPASTATRIIQFLIRGAVRIHC